MYVDDISIIYVSNDVEDIECYVNIDLDRICIWFVVNKFILNMIKIEFLLIGFR